MREFRGNLCYDGDTCYITMPALPQSLSKMSVRILGIDTPEIKGKCSKEKGMALLGRKFANNLFKNARDIEFKNLKWVLASAEKLPIEDNSFDIYTISFGLRNTKNLNQALSEAHRVLKPGGRYLCLEFSKIQNLGLNSIYKNYSKLIPYIGQLIVGEKKPYEYLIKSIENFINQDELIELMIKNNFQNCTYRNLSGGIVSIHSGWKV